MRRTVALSVTVLLLAAAGYASAKGTPAYFTKQATWQETVRLSREALARDEGNTDDADAATDTEPLPGGVTLGPWYLAGPFPLPKSVPAEKGFDHAFGPEKAVDLKKAYGAVRWKRQKKFVDGVRQGLPTNVVGSTYLYRTITAAAPTKMTIYLGSDDGLAVWLNGKQVLERNVARGVVPGDDRVALGLAKGTNHLLLKVYNLRGGHGVYFHTSPTPAHAKTGTDVPEPHEKLWKAVEAAFPDAQSRHQMTWERKDHIWNDDWPAGTLTGLAQRYAKAITAPTLAQWAAALAKEAGSPEGLHKVRLVYYQAKRMEEAAATLRALNTTALRLGIADLAETFGDRYPNGSAYLARLVALETRATALAQGVASGNKAAAEQLATVSADLASLKREALLTNPLLDGADLLVVRRTFGKNARTVIGRSLGMPSLNSHTHDTIKHSGWDNDIAILSNLRGGGTLRTLYRPDGGKPLCDVALHFNADRLMFSSIGTHDRWHILEVAADGSGLRQLTPTDIEDVDFFDSCYLPDGHVAVTTTAGYQGLPCENGGKPMAQLYLLDPKTKALRQITFEQDSDWAPVVKNDGRLMYLRWEYTDTPHYFTRILFHANPDGTEQMELYGSNSYFPNAFFFARPIPHDPTRVIGVAGGHHGISRSGRLLLLDTAVSRREANGVVQEIPGRGQRVEPVIRDRLVDGVWPHFLHPYPLGDTEGGKGAGKYFLVSAKLNEDALWGLYLVDVFDNITLIKEVEGAALLEPIPLAKRPTPPVIPPKIDPSRKDALVYLMDAHIGPGLAGVPRGAVKRLRLTTYHYAYNRSGGHRSVGIESSWDVKRILGTVPVEADGSAYFRVPANTPVFVQPLDAKGRALALMRSWFVGQPGEILACVGCHEPQDQAPPNVAMQAVRRPPSEIEPWHGPARPFGFETEIQPVLDKYCAACHDGARGNAVPNFTVRGPSVDVQAGKRGSARVSASYVALQPYVRRPGPESDYHLFRPMEYHASTSELVQMLEKGHHNVQLDTEAWQRLAAWIDLNAPYVGHWDPPEWRGQDQRRRRLELAKRYAGVEADPETEYRRLAKALKARGPIRPITPKPRVVKSVAMPRLAAWPLPADKAKRLQATAASPPTRTVDLGNGLTMDLVLAPAGEFVMGSAGGPADQHPPSAVRIDRPFWIGVREVTNAAFARFDPDHDSGFIDRSGKDQRVRGYPANLPEQPVVRVTWRQAMAFCRWLSEQTGQACTLPTEAQWEWACRAGTESDLWFGPATDNFAPFANLADKAAAKVRTTPFPVAKQYDDHVGIPTGKEPYKPNPWGLLNVHGNVAEWTRSTYTPYPYRADDGRNDIRAAGRRVVRGGSWRDRPERATSGFRLPYEPYQRVFNVGFRIVMEEPGPTGPVAVRP